MQLRPLFSAAIAFLALVATSVAQEGRFTINGRVKIEGGSIDDTKVVVYRNGVKDRVVNNNLSKFALDLDLNQSYVLSFEKDGFVTKKLSFDTHAPAEAIANGFTPFEFAVSMFKQYDDVNMVVFNQPVGKIRFEPTVDDFDYDTDYTKSIQSQLAKTMEEVAQKQKEEAEKADAEAKHKAEEEKNKAKADADAQRLAAEQAKLQIKQQKDHEAATKTAEVEEQKAALAAKKLEQERLAEELRKAKETAKPKPVPKPEPKPKPDPPAPMAKETPKPKAAPVIKAEVPKPKPAPRVVKANYSEAKPHEGVDDRAGLQANTAQEESPVRPAQAVLKEELRPEVMPVVAEKVRKEELIVEPNQVVTRIELQTDAQKSEYRKVVRKYGGTFYFKNGEPCSQLIYESEALADRR